MSLNNILFSYIHDLTPCGGIATTFVFCIKQSNRSCKENLQIDGKMQISSLFSVFLQLGNWFPLLNVSEQLLNVPDSAGIQIIRPILD